MSSATFRERPWTRVELVSMDGQCNDLTIALYRQETPDGAIGIVHTYSSAPGAQERVRFVAGAMRTLGDLAAAGDDPAAVAFACGTWHAAIARRLFLEAVKVDQTAPVTPRPLELLDQKTGQTIVAEPTGGGTYRLTARDVGDGAEPRRGRRPRAAQARGAAGRRRRADGELRVRRRPPRAGRAAAAPRRQRPPGHPRGGGDGRSRPAHRPGSTGMSETAQVPPMTSRERVLAALRREPVDRTPLVNPTSVATVELMDLVDAPFPDANREPELMARLAATGHTELGFDSIMPVFSIIQESSALGCKMQWEQKDNWPTVRMREPIYEDAGRHPDPRRPARPSRHAAA